MKKAGGGGAGIFLFGGLTSGRQSCNFIRFSFLRNSVSREWKRTLARFGGLLHDAFSVF
jgi:hypothetical protein